MFENVLKILRMEFYTFLYSSTNPQQFYCNATTISGRDLSQKIVNHLSLRKNFIPNIQIVEGNCKSGQSVDDLY